jgi:hypothetical protein
MHPGCEVLMDAPMSRRGKRMLQALADTAPAGSVVTTAYTGSRRVLALYGAGLPARAAVMRAHLARGGRVAAWDLGYWDRDDAMRVSVDNLHPTAAQLALAPAGETRRPVALREDADPAGPVLLVGIGPKSCDLLGLRFLQWETAALQRIKRSHPGRRVLWRPKGKRPVQLPGATLAHGQPIEDALRGCSLVVCRHSNVAIDAAIAGVPVQCDDGAARALYATNPAPAPAERAEFLRRLAWWNWRPTEAAQAWAWINKATSA